MDEEFSNGRLLNLDNPEDLSELLGIAETHPEWRDLIPPNIGFYLSTFRDTYWRMVHPGGHIFRPSPGGLVLSFLDVMDRAVKLKQFVACAGYDELLKGLTNPTQVKATFFEIDIAHFLSTRSIHQGLTFSPGVLVRGGIKFPDFGWETTLGLIHCECKTWAWTPDTQAQRLQRYMGIIDKELEDRPLEGLRIDMVLNPPITNGVEGRIVQVLRYLTGPNGESEGTFSLGEVTATIRDRSLDRPSEGAVLYGSTMVVGEESMVLGPTSAKFSVAISLEWHWKKAVAASIKDARTQLPDSGLNMIAVEVPRISRVENEVLRLIGDDAHVGSPLILLWDGREAKAIYRLNQPLDGRIMVD